ncbi:hypothetical protein WN943_008355 [Citrus x changshan-huyou]
MRVLESTSLGETRLLALSVEPVLEQFTAFKGSKMLHTYLDHLTSVMFTVTEMFLHFDDSMRASDYGDFCALKIALGTWVFSVAGALLAIPVGIKRKSLAPLVFFGTTGTMLDIIMGVSACEREHAERQMKLLEAQNAAADASLTETGTET